MPSDEITLKEFMDLRFQALEKKVDELRQFIEKRDDQMTRLVQETGKRVENLEDWRLVIESQFRIYRYICGLIVAIIVAMVIAWLRQWLGL